jgi:hypothetical protein
MIIEIMLTMLLLLPPVGGDPMEGGIKLLLIGDNDDRKGSFDSPVDGEEDGGSTMVTCCC